MKVYGVPEELPAPEIDFQNYNPKAVKQAEEQHEKDLVDFLKSYGYTGPNTGRIYSTARGDGYANYMFADAGRQSVLIHLPYGDGWHDPDVEFIPKREILKRIAQREAQPTLASLFA